MDASRCLDATYRPVQIHGMKQGKDIVCSRLNLGRVMCSAIAAQDLLAALTHPHSRVRLAAISALDALVASGQAAAGQVDSLLAPGLKPTAHDRAPQVRDALMVAVANWLGYSTSSSGTAGGSDAAAAPSPSSSSAAASGGNNMPPRERVRAYGASLLPLLLTGVTDPQPASASLALSLAEGVGAAWSGDKASGGDTDVQMRDASGAEASTSAGMEVDESEAAVAGAVFACQLGLPYTGRPGAGIRGLVQSLLSALLPPLIKELGEWTVGLRAAAARQLHTVLVLAEASSTPHLQALVPALCK